MRHYGHQQHLYTLNDTFMLDFSLRKQFFTVITEKGRETLIFFALFAESRPMAIRPYTGAYTIHHLWIDDSNESLGAALARFEPSTLPDHKGTRTIVLRFLKILVITPVKCVIPHLDSYIRQPKEGELHWRFRRAMRPSAWIPWGLNIDKPNSTVGIKNTRAL